MTKPIALEYPEDYIEACFYAWYKAGHPHLGTVNGGQVMKHIPNAPDGRKAMLSTLRIWKDKYGWIERADAMDAELSRVLDKDAIKERAKIINELAKAGKKMMDVGVAYFDKEQDPFKDNPSAAVKATVSGAEMVFKYAGHVEALLAVYQMSDKQLDREMLRLLGKNENDENMVDAVLEDVPDISDIPSEDADTESDDND